MPQKLPLLMRQYHRERREGKSMNVTDTENRIAQAKQMFQDVFPDPKGILKAVEVYVVDGKHWLDAIRESDAQCKSTQSSATEIAALQASAFQSGDKEWILLRKSVMRGNAAFHIVLWHELAHIYAAHYENRSQSLFHHCKALCCADAHSEEDLMFFRGYQLWSELIAQSMAFLLCTKYNMKPSGDALYEIQGQLTRATQLRKVDPLAIYRAGQATGLALAGYKKYLYHVWQLYNGGSKKYALPLKF